MNSEMITLTKEEYRQRLFTVFRIAEALCKDPAEAVFTKSEIEYELSHLLSPEEGVPADLLNL